MTEKELLYVEDALGHVKYVESACKEAASKIADPELKACVEDVGKRQAALFQSFYQLL